MVPDAYRRNPELVLRHALTLLSIAPEIEDLIPVSDQLARSFEFTREGKSRFWTLRLANGLVDFLLACFAEVGGGSLYFENVHAADPLDQELVVVLLRRAAPDNLLVRVGTRSHEVGEPLLSALRAYARITDLSGETASSAWRAPDASPPAQRSLAEAYVTSDCTLDDPLAQRAYEALDPAMVRELHFTRATALERMSQRSLTLGAIPFHWERAALNVAPFLAAADYCMRMAYYEACLDLARRGAAQVDVHSPEYGELGRHIVFSLLQLHRLDEVESYCREVDVLGDQTLLRSHCAYAMAILNARVYEKERRDYDAARAWVHKATALAELGPETDAKVVNLAFLRNTLALVEMHTGNPQEAQRLLSDGLQRLEMDAPSMYQMESVVLLRNRARLHFSLGQPERALEDYATLLRHEPSNSEAHLDRGIIYQRLGRHREALADYDLAIAWSPPYDEAYFNRAQMLSALGRKDEALEDYRYVLELEPDHLGAHVHRAGLLFERGELTAARQDVDRALARSPRHAKALCMLGLLEMAQSRWAEAQSAFDLALESDNSEATAWINRATLHFRRGEPEAALRDLDRALQLRPDATALYNRARILQSLERRRVGQ